MIIRSRNSLRWIVSATFVGFACALSLDAYPVSLDLQRIPWLASRIGPNIDLTGTSVSSTAAASENRESDERPNFVVVVLDDADYTMFRDSSWQLHFPNIAQIAASGVTFTNCHATTPKCCPSRASFFRGQYANKLGIQTNKSSAVLSNGFPGGCPPYRQRDFDRDDLPVWLRFAGYRTMLVGKYLHNDFDYSIPVGWDDFHTSLGNKYFGTRLFTNATHPGGQFSQLADDQYRTRAEGLAACDLIRNHLSATAASRQPFFLYFAPLAPHEPPARSKRVEPRYADALPDLVRPSQASVNEADVSDKPEIIRNAPLLSSAQLDALDSIYRERVLAVKSVDDMLGEIFQVLHTYGAFQNTYLVVTSDHGFVLGEHRLLGKSLPYQEATQIPLFVSGSDVAAGRVADHLLAHFDLTATLLELAAVPLPNFLDAVSFVPLLRQPDDFPATEWRHSILLEHWESMPARGHQIDTVYVGLRTYDECYIEWAHGESEYYDLRTDPQQLENRIHELPAPVREFWSEMMRVHRQQGSGPQATIANPPMDKGTSFHPAASQIFGYANDDTGIQRVRLIILDPSTGTYWNGHTWQSAYVQLIPEVARAGGLLTKWSYHLDLNGQLHAPLVRLHVNVRAVDVDGLVSQNTTRRVLTIDSEPPETVLVRPNRNEVLASPPRIQGFASDNLWAGRVQIAIRDLANGHYWNGQGWQPQYANVAQSVGDDGEWSYSPSLPPGRYGVWVRSLDTVGNIDPTPASTLFRVGD